jgi:hypothetical protein
VNIERLNQAYIRLIKMVLNRTFKVNPQYLNSFYRDPSPQEAYLLLNKIFSQEELATWDADRNELIVNNLNKPQLRAAKEREEDHKNGCGVDK